jgi:hypothetical protein
MQVSMLGRERAREGDAAAEPSIPASRFKLLLDHQNAQA